MDTNMQRKKLIIIIEKWFFADIFQQHLAFCHISKLTKFFAAESVTILESPGNSQNIKLCGWLLKIMDTTKMKTVENIVKYMYEMCGKESGRSDKNKVDKAIKY